MKSPVRFGILGAFIALAAALGAIGSSQFAAPADAQIPFGVSVVKECSAAPLPALPLVDPIPPLVAPITAIPIGGTAFCRTIVSTGIVLPPVPGPITLTVTGGGVDNGAVQLLGPASGTGATGNAVASVNIVNPGPVGAGPLAAQSITVGCFPVGPATPCALAPFGPPLGVGAPVGNAIVITTAEKGAVGGPIVETIKFGAGAPVAIGGLNLVGPATAAATIGCVPATINAGTGAAGGAACTITPTDNDAFPATIAAGTFNLTLTGPAGVVFGGVGGGGTTISIACGAGAAAQGCGPTPFTIVSNTANVAGPVTVSVAYISGNAAVDANFTTAALPAVNVVAAGAVTAFTKAFAPAAIAVGQTSTLTFTISNPAGTAGGVTGIAFTDNLPAGVQVAAVPALTNTCAGAAVAAAGTTTVTLTGGTIAAPGGTCTITVAVTATTPGVKLNTTGTITSTQGGVGGTAAATLDVSNIALFRQPTGFIFTCLTGVAGPFTNPIPGQIGGINVLAVGELPAGLQCQVQLASLNAAGVLTAGTFAPGTFEVSSLQAGIQSAVGTLSTNIRIGCDTAATVNLVLNPLIDQNTCQGVTFRVFGFGVGFVEIRVRYEPLAVAAQAGIIEIEGAFNVAFVAPVVTVSLALSPNPVTVGSTSTATARFNRTINCQQAFGSAAAPLACIDPTTGAPIIFNLGSALNGSVVFNVDNTPVASFTDVTAAPPSPQTAGFITTANQVVRRCGFFPTAGLPANPITGVPGLGSSLIGGPLNGFFGGCETATATLRGNAPGIANVSATFIPDMPGAFGSSLVGLGTQVTGLLGIFGNAVNPTSARVLEVVGPAASGAVQLARGCNNVSPTVSETAAAYGARVTPAAALVAIWEHQAATNTFRGFSPQAGAPNDLAGVTRLKPVFVCVSGAATLDQPAA